MKKIVWIIAICCLVAVIAAVVIGVAVPEMQKQQEKERLEKAYTEQIEKNIESFKKAHPEISCDIRYTLIVFDSGNISLSYYVEGDSAERYDDHNQTCYGFYDLFELDDYTMLTMYGKLHINDHLICSFHGIEEEILRAREDRNTCDYYIGGQCENKPISGSDFCDEHRGWD